MSIHLLKSQKDESLKTAQMDQDNKHYYFNKLHRALAKKYWLSVEHISFLRDKAIGESLTIDVIIDEVAENIRKKQRAIKQFNIDELDRNKQLKEDFNLTLLHLQSDKMLLSFLNSCSEEVWKDITQKTDFDFRKSREGAQKPLIKGNDGLLRKL